MNVMKFDGDHATLKVPESVGSALTESVTIEAWGCGDYDGENRSIFKNLSEENRGETQKTHLNRGVCFGTGWGLLGDDNQFAHRTSSGLQKNRWTHLAVTYDHTTNELMLYTNGEPDSESGHPASFIVEGILGIGGYQGFKLYGKMADFRLWNVARTPAEIKKLMHQRLRGREVGLVGYWPLENVEDSEHILETADLTPPSYPAIVQYDDQDATTSQVDPKHLIDDDADLTLRPVEEALKADKAALRAIIQAAVDVELFTIPLYMTTLYSIQGTYPGPPDGADLWPGQRPTPASSDMNQQAFNAIFSVFVQEMLHLQLAANLATSMGLKVRFKAPVYSGSSIPYIADLSQIPGYEDVQVRLGPLDENQIKLFLAIEMPEWDATLQQKKPEVPFKDWYVYEDGTHSPLPEFGTIGNLYQCLREYMDLEYDGGDRLWDYVYDAEAIQVDMFNFTTKGHDTNPTRLNVYSEFPVRVRNRLEMEDDIEDDVVALLEGWSPRGDAHAMIDAICCQGEGASAHQGGVNPAYVPSFKAIKSNMSSHWWGAGAAEMRALWDQQTHYDRFRQVARWLDKVETWPQWWEKRGNFNAWTWEDLVVSPELADDKTWNFAKQRAQAMNQPSLGRELNDLLNSCYNSLLSDIEESWANPDWRYRNKAGEYMKSPFDMFPFSAMIALYSRVSAVWAVNAVPELKELRPKDWQVQGTPHACQGMEPDNPGKNTCANAISHICEMDNKCRMQGGCGWHDAGQSEFWAPSMNSCQGKGGCGAPIPAAQAYHFAHNLQVGDGHAPISVKIGDSVAMVAWKAFLTKNNLSKDKHPQPDPTNLRLVLPPS